MYKHLLPRSTRNVKAYSSVWSFIRTEQKYFQVIKKSSLTTLTLPQLNSGQMKERHFDNPVWSLSSFSWLCCAMINTVTVLCLFPCGTKKKNLFCSTCKCAFFKYDIPVVWGQQVKLGTNINADCVIVYSKKKKKKKDEFKTKLFSGVVRPSGVERVKARSQ